MRHPPPGLSRVATELTGLPFTASCRVAETSYYRGLEYLEEKRLVGSNQYTERVAQNEPPTAEAGWEQSVHGEGCAKCTPHKNS
jgi:hypothetical protein